MTGTCDRCKVSDVPVESDHRIPKRFGGADLAANRHDLCLDCHRQKSGLEGQLSMNPRDRATHDQWFAFAFPVPVPFETCHYIKAWYAETEADPESRARMEAADRGRAVHA